MWDRNFWLAVLERAIKTTAQIGALVLGTFVLTDIEQVIPLVNGMLIAMAAGFALSVLTSLASAPISGSGPSLGPELLAGHSPEDADAGTGL